VPAEGLDQAIQGFHGEITLVDWEISGVMKAQKFKS
jgi:hypothetical protein